MERLRPGGEGFGEGEGIPYYLLLRRPVVFLYRRWCPEFEVETWEKQGGGRGFAN